MKKLFFKLLLIILPAGTLVVSFNYLIDPGNIFSSAEYVGGIANILSKGHNADNVSNYDERLLQEQMIKRLGRNPDIVVLGSSRIMEAGSDFFPGRHVLNCGVSHANIFDVIAITGILDSLQRLPSEIYLNADIGLVSRQATAEWQSLEAYYSRFTSRYTTEKNNYNPASLRFKKLYSLVSFGYFRESLSFLIKGASKQYIDAGTGKPGNYGRYSDGTVAYPESYMQPDTGKIASDAYTTAKQEGLSLPDSGKILLLNELLDFYAARKVKVHLVLLPYHPGYYAGANSRQDHVFDWYESFYRRLAADRHIGINGGFNAFAQQVFIREFYDMFHCSKDAVKRVFFNS